MYDVDEKDQVVELTGVPLPDPGAPEVALFATEDRLVLTYLVSKRERGPIGTSGRRLSPDDPSPDPIALVEFISPRDHRLGPPNDEALEGHPLASRGLRPYRCFEVEQSSWIRALERQNRIHPRHDPERYKQLRHYVVTFHDSTFECVASGIEYGIHQRSDPKVASVIRAFSLDRENPG